MLVQFRFSNFRCFREAQTLSLLASSHKNRPHLLRSEAPELHLLRVAAIYGANASGKSTILEALQFVQSAVVNSHQKWLPGSGVPVDPHRPALRSTSRFEVTFVVSETLFEYTFEVDRGQVVEERLTASRGRRHLWFERLANRDEPFIFGKALRGENRAIARLTRPNSLFLSAAAANNHPMLGPAYSWFESKLRFSGNRDLVDRFVHTLRVIQTSGDRARVLEFLRKADLGISGLFLEEDGSSGFRIELRHLSGPQVFSLPFEQESEGTRAWFALAAPVLNSLDQGSILSFDEIDASLHPYLVREVVRIFQDPVRNPKGAQLLFTTHDATLLGDLPDDSPLARDEVWVTERLPEGGSQLVPLSDYKPRNDENLERGYLLGRYRGVPILDFAA